MVMKEIGGEKEIGAGAQDFFKGQEVSQVSKPASPWHWQTWQSAVRVRRAACHALTVYFRINQRRQRAAALQSRLRRQYCVSCPQTSALKGGSKNSVFNRE
jgi:hypothetical protein